MAKKGDLNKFQEIESEDRPVRIKKYKFLFLIVCEDESTEPKYFLNFKKHIPEETIYLKTVGTGRKPKGIVERAIEEKSLLEKEAKKTVDKVWVVFDKDDEDLNKTTIENFEKAFEIAAQENFEIAYSNEVFELWLLLHLTNINANVPLPRAEVYALLQEHIRGYEAHKTFEYEHGNALILQIIYEVGSQVDAINRAEELLQSQQGKTIIEANPSTRVHILVKDLLEWIAYFSYETR
ncbi:MAG: RloB family protein [Flavobacterium sp.]|nr:RloB family protein [Flavobacterium sp.]